MRTETALVELLKDSRDYRIYFKGCCEKSAFRLRAQASQFREELAKRGYVAPLDAVEDTLLELARNVFPDSPAAEWDAQWASRLAREALERLAEHYVGLGGDERLQLNLEAQDEFHDRMNEAGEENDPAAFRRALAGWEQAGLEAFKESRSRKPVAS